MIAPYAKIHAEAARAGFAPLRAIFVLDGWKLKPLLHRERGVWQALVPDDAEPSSFDWSWCAGFPVLVLTASMKRILALGEALAGVKPLSLDFLLASPGGPILLPWIDLHATK